MLLHFEFFSEKYKAQKENIDGVLYGGVSLDLFPGLFHFLAPMYVIKNEYGMTVGFGKNLLKILKGGLITMVAVNIGQVNR